MPKILKKEKKTISVLEGKLGEVVLYNNVFEEEQSLHYLEIFRSSLSFETEKVFVHGKWRSPKRMTCAYGDDALEYSYSGAKKKALQWTEELLEVKNKVEQITGANFNFVLCNLYEDGNSVIGKHADDEKDLEKGSVIAGVSFSKKENERDMLFHQKKKNGELVKSVRLQNGSVIVMKGETQKNYYHSIPKRAKVKGPRINLTFRTIKK